MKGILDMKEGIEVEMEKMVISPNKVVGGGCPAASTWLNRTD